MNKKPIMLDSQVEFAKIKLQVDPINRVRTENSDNAMAIFYEEQPFMWEFVKKQVIKTLNTATGLVDFLDVGTGSGVWSLIISKNTIAKNIVAIDKSNRAIKIAKQNKKTNRTSFQIREEFYNISTAPHRSCKVIGLYPPYHLYPEEVENLVPQHARGGIYGQQVLKEQLITMNYHLADDGIIIFNQMCLGDKKGPEFVKYIPQIVENSSLNYTNILPPIETSKFLRGVYGNKHKEYQRNVAKKWPFLYYTTGWISRDNKKEINEIKHDVNLHGRAWEDRVLLHKEIANHTL